MIAQEIRFQELATRVAESGCVRFTRFLDPAQAKMAEQAARFAGVSLQLWGGMFDTERKMGAFTPTADVQVQEWPLVCVKVSWNARYGSPAHRDLLGAVLALGMERALLGDIVVGDGEAYAFATQEMGALMVENLRAAGRITLCAAIQAQMPELPEPEGKTRYDTVPSLRLDAVLAAAWQLSRAQAQALIREGRVRVDYLEEMRVDAMLAEDSLISVRGMGRAKVETVGPMNRKGRVGITLMRFG